EYDLRDTIKTEKKLLLFSGFYPRRRSKNNILYVFRAGLNIFVSYAQLFSMIVQMVMDRNDLSKLSETILFFMTHVTFLGKLTNFGYYRSNLFNIEDALTNPVFYGFSSECLAVLKKKMASCNLVAKIFRMLCILAVLLYTSVPFLDESKTKSLPLPGWLPFNTRKYYYLGVIFQIASVSITAYNNSSIDILTWMLITVATAEFDILKENLKTINFRSECEARANKTVFKNCIKHHKAIVKYENEFYYNVLFYCTISYDFSLIHKIEATFSKGIFLQFFASVVSFPSVQFGFLVMYLLCMLWQVGMYCWFGHDVMTTSNDIGHFFYMSNWYESRVTIRKDFYIFFERTKKPVTLTAGKFITLSLTTLTGILRSSYSYFAVLQHIYKKP
ncbi:7tm 6 domain containing protein, partial [Asbolus verrucosus]